MCRGGGEALRGLRHPRLRRARGLTLPLGPYGPRRRDPFGNGMAVGLAARPPYGPAGHSHEPVSVQGFPPPPLPPLGPSPLRSAPRGRPMPLALASAPARPSTPRQARFLVCWLFGKGFFGGALTRFIPSLRSGISISRSTGELRGVPISLGFSWPLGIGGEGRGSVGAASAAPPGPLNGWRRWGRKRAPASVDIPSRAKGVALGRGGRAGLSGLVCSSSRPPALPAGPMLESRRSSGQLDPWAVAGCGCDGRQGGLRVRRAGRHCMVGTVSGRGTVPTYTAGGRCHGRNPAHHDPGG